MVPNKVKVRVKTQTESDVKKEVFLPENTGIKEDSPKKYGEVVREVIIPEKVYTPPEETQKKEEVPVFSDKDIFSFMPESKEEETVQNEKQETPKKKNVIFFFTDQQRYDTFNEDIMPNLFALSQEGVKFDNCFTCQPVCGPARACLQSGVYPTQTGCWKNGISLPGDIKPLAEFFNEAGYDTAYIGKWHLASDKDFRCEKTPVPRERQGGYNYWRASDVLEFTSHGYDGYVFDEKGEQIDFIGYRADCINEFALEYIENRDEEKPFFMFLSFIEPHHQNDKRRFEGYRQTVDSFRNYPIPEDLSFLKGDYKKHYPDYLSAINRVDCNLGKLIAKLKEKGIYEDTVIVFTSDHGCHFKTRNLEYKRSCHDSSIHIPLVIKGGAFKGGTSDGRLVSLIDLPPTLLSLAGIEKPDCFAGNDLSGGDTRKAVYIQISESECARAIRTEDYTYCVSVPGYAAGMKMADSPVYQEEYLYDLISDPLQKNNLIKDNNYKIVRSAMKKLLLAEMEKAEGKKAVIVPALAAKKK